MKNDRYSCNELGLSVLTDPLTFVFTFQVILRKFQMYLRIQRNFQNKLDGEIYFDTKKLVVNTIQLKNIESAVRSLNIFPSICDDMLCICCLHLMFL